jgi:ATP-dependent metalloprotease
MGGHVAEELFISQ